MLLVVISIISAKRNVIVKFHLLPYSTVNKDGNIKQITENENSLSTLNLLNKKVQIKIVGKIKIPKLCGDLNSYKNIKYFSIYFPTEELLK